MIRSLFGNIAVRHATIAIGMAILALTPAFYVTALPQQTYPTIQKSLALVAYERTITQEGERRVSRSFGTAFCISSTDEVSYFLTNEHVVRDADKVTLKSEYVAEFERESPILSRPLAPGSLDGEVMQHSADLDLAVIRVKWDRPLVPIPLGRLRDLSEYRKVDPIPHLRLTSHPPSIGTSVGIAGYPTIATSGGVVNMINLLTTSNPTAHFGQINGYIKDQVKGKSVDRYIEYDALTDNGNSGGPLFDANTGVVYGIVDLVKFSRSEVNVKNNMAIPGAMAVEWLKANSVPFKLAD